MSALRGLLLAFSSFSKIPVPQLAWDEANMRYMMCFFPLVGVVIGLALAAWLWLAQQLAFGPPLRGAGVVLVPAAISGAIHLDGFADTVDALSSHAAPERRREILKDPHTGAFAGIAVAAYLVAYAALASELAPSWRIAVMLGGLHVASRCLSAVATLAFSTSSSDGMLAAFHASGAGAGRLAVLLAELAACAAAMAWAAAPAAGAMLGVGLACLAALRPFANARFGGMSGDVAGFFLQVSELAMLAALVVVTKAVGL